MQQDSSGWTQFDTAIGGCAIGWGARGIVAVQLPEADAQATQARLFKTTGPLPLAEPPAAVASAISAVQAMLAGQAQDASEVLLDMQGVTQFQRQVYALARRIPWGQTRTYGELAAELGNKNLSRAVGQALGLNPFAPLVPCHRILAAGRKPGGFSAYGGAATKMRMLAAEGALLGDTPSLLGPD